jgi:hypothetical protein
MPELPPTATPRTPGAVVPNPPPAAGIAGAAAAEAGSGRGTREIGGPPGPEPTRYGDWEKNGRCIDF